MKSVQYAALAALPFAVSAQELSSAPLSSAAQATTPSAIEDLAPAPTGIEVVTLLSTGSVVRNTLSSVDLNADIPVITPTETVTGSFISPLASVTSLPNEVLFSTFTGPFETVATLSPIPSAESIPGTRTFIEVPDYSLTGLAQTTASTLISIGDKGQIYTTLVPVGENPTPVPNTGIVGYTDGAGDVQFYTTLDYGHPVRNTPRPDLSTTVTNSFQPYPTENAEDASVRTVTGVRRIGANYTSTYTDEGYADATQVAEVRTVTGVNRYGMSYTSTFTDEGYYPSNTVVSGIVSDGATSILTNPYRITGTQTASGVAAPSPWYNPVWPYGPSNGTTAMTSVGPSGTGVGPPGSSGSAAPEPFEGGSAKTGIAGGAVILVAGLAAALIM